MIGFVFFFLVLVLGALGLVAGLQALGILPPRQAPPGERPARETFHRLEEALAALESRLDRVEDQQRFLERLLEARPDPARLGPGGGRQEQDAAGADSVLFDVEKGDA